MTTVAEIYGLREVTGALVGVELEIEGTNLPESVSNPAWSVHRDGSLRGGLEYVFSSPLGSVAAKDALEWLGRHLDERGCELDYTYRTSTHVHVNVSNLSIDVVKAMVVLFTLFEDEYINYCARIRRGNRFCLSAKDADGVIDILRSFLKSGTVPSRGNGKYSAMNLCPLNSFGTLEFRTLEGTNDWNRIFTWIRALLALRKAAKELGSAKAVLATDREELAKLVFPTERLRTQFLKDGWENRFEYTKSVCHDAFNVVKKD